MIIGKDQEVEAQTIDSPEVKNAKMKELISPAEGWTDHVMRVIELGDGEGYSPKHTHDWPHINYVLEGQGVLHVDGEDTSVEAGSYAFVPPGSHHQFRNAGSGAFRFICIVPKEGHIT